ATVPCRLMRFRAREVAEATGGRLVGPDVEIHGVAFDSRALRPGQLFVPIVAERDGHDFVGSAIGSGAVAYLTSRGADPTFTATAIEIDDTLRALMDLARVQRDRVAVPVVGITGSVGKTSTKDMVRAALGASRRTWANEKSFNNEMGLPTTLLNAPDDTEVMVLEMGMRGFGEITELCRIARPTTGVVTRVAEAHSDRVGGIEGVARAKAELVQALPSDGTAILNADDPRVVAMSSLTGARVITFGESESADVRVTRLVLDESVRPTFVAVTPWGEFEVRLGVSGRHMALNAAAALAVVGSLGADLGAGAAALTDVGLTPMRMSVVRTASGGTVLDDSYNANPTSMRAALDALAAMPATRRVAVLGRMAEISDPEAEHLAITRYAADLGVAVVAVGTDLYGVVPCADHEAAVAAVGSVAGGEAVLVKGSRVVGLERVSAVLALL
ncbi:MAG: UDP-N-acetylmuramoyl-tripeptide--D-alanyl-D-alanine ligase, partial [Actinomycetota bacterium]